MPIRPPPSRALALLACVPLMVSIAVADIPSASDDCEADLVERTPSSDFTPLEDGDVVRHEPTGLEWRRCPEGMDWNGSGCDGFASSMNWQEALQYADDVDGWRLPNINELRSIVERCRRSPAINQQVFPDTPTSSFCSASPYAGASGHAWHVSFGSGNHNWNRKSLNYRVRLVRGGQ